jgi:hypothetical protein
MRNESVTKFDQIVRRRNLIILAATDVVLFLIANVAYGAGNQHGRSLLWLRSYGGA